MKNIEKLAEIGERRLNLDAELMIMEIGNSMKYLKDLLRYSNRRETLHYKKTFLMKINHYNLIRKEMKECGLPVQEHDEKIKEYLPNYLPEKNLKNYVPRYLQAKILKKR